MSEAKKKLILDKLSESTNFTQRQLLLKALWKLQQSGRLAKSTASSGGK